MSDDETPETVGVVLTKSEARVLAEVCRMLEKEPARIANLFLQHVSPSVAVIERENMARVQQTGSIAFGKVFQAITKTFGQLKKGPQRLENGGERR